MKPDSKVHRHPGGGYTLACETVLDGKPAIVVYRAWKGQNGGGKAAWWVTGATIASLEGDDTEHPVYGTAPLCRTVRDGYTLRQALDVYHLNEEGFVLRGNVAVRARFGKADIKFLPTEQS